MGNAISPNGKIFNSELAFATGIIDKEQKEILQKKYADTTKTSVDLAKEFIEDLHTWVEFHDLALVSDQKFLLAIGEATMKYLNHRITSK